VLLIAGQFDPDELLLHRRRILGTFPPGAASEEPPLVVAVKAPRSFTDSGSRIDIG